MSLLIPPYNGLANKIQQAINQFVGRQITPQLQAQVKATVENVLAFEDPFNDMEVDVVLDSCGQMQVNMKPKNPLDIKPGPWKGDPFSRRGIYKRVVNEQCRLSDKYVTFIHDPRDIEPSDTYDLNQFFLY